MQPSKKGTQPVEKMIHVLCRPVLRTTAGHELGRMEMNCQDLTTAVTVQSCSGLEDGQSRVHWLSGNRTDVHGKP